MAWEPAGLALTQGCCVEASALSPILGFMPSTIPYGLSCPEVAWSSMCHVLR